MKFLSSRVLSRHFPILLEITPELSRKMGSAGFNYRLAWNVYQGGPFNMMTNTISYPWEFDLKERL